MNTNTEAKSTTDRSECEWGARCTNPSVGSTPNAVQICMACAALSGLRINQKIGEQR